MLSYIEEAIAYWEPMKEEQPKIKFIVPAHPTGKVKLFGRVYMSSLTPAIIASLTPDNYLFSVIDEHVEPVNFSEPVDLVAISALTPTADRAYEIADEYRKKGVKVVMGGIHPTLVPKEAIKHADSVVIGEAEGSWQQLLKDFQQGHLKKFYESPDKPNLSCLPLPRRELIEDNKKYVTIHKVETSRGCPYNCSFCSTTRFFGNKIRYRPVSEVIEEVRKLKTKFIFFTDNNIVGNLRYAKELFRELAKLKIKWIGQASLNSAKHLETLKLMAKSGCVGLLIGLESLSDKALTEMGKKINLLQNYREAIKKIHKARIGVIGCFVFGFDHDSSDVFKKTAKFIKKMKIEVPQFTILTPFPGTRLRESLEKAGRILHSRWKEYDVMQVVYKPLNFDPGQLKKLYDRTCQRIYSWPSIMLRLLKISFHLKSLYKVLVFLQLNIVYRRIWLTSQKY